MRLSNLLQKIIKITCFFGALVLFSCDSIPESSNRLADKLDLYGGSSPNHEVSKPFEFKNNSEGKDIFDLFSNNSKEANIFEIYKSGEIKSSFADIAGLEKPKESLKDIIKYLKDPADFRRLGAEPPSGVIFYGPPGTGKTAMARALAGEVGKEKEVSFIVASGASFENKYVGVGADNVRKLFELARKNKPAIIFIDEFDAVAGVRSEEKKNAQVVNQLLTELDGFSKEDRNDIFIIAATNLLSSIDPAVIRPGRIDRKIKIGFPDEIARKAILGHYFSLAPAITHAKAQDYVRATRNWSAAEIKAFVNEARIHATIRNAQYVDKNDLNAALKKVQDSRAGR